MTRLGLAAALLLVLALPAHAQDSLPPLHVSGYFESAWAVAEHHDGRRNVGDLYQPRYGEFALSAAMLKVERAAPEKARGAGFVIEALAGDHAESSHAAGFDLGEHADLLQAYAVLAFPAQRLQILVGKMITLLGNELVETTGNQNLSVGSQFVFVENTTNTGICASWDGGHGWSGNLQLMNGWDVVVDNNSQKTVFGKFGWSDSAATRGITLLGYAGRELPDSVRGVRSGGELLANAPVGPLKVVLQLDAGRDAALDATWRAAGLWVLVPLRKDRLDLALRGDVLDDADGARTSGALGFPDVDRQTLTGLTGTLVIKSIPGALIRPELRYDRSSRAVFDGHRDQWTAALGVALQF